MEKQLKKMIINNFLCSLDRKKPMIDHFRNVMKDSIQSKWKNQTLVTILVEIEKSYKNQGKK